MECLLRPSRIRAKVIQIQFIRINSIIFSNLCFGLLEVDSYTILLKLSFGLSFDLLVKTNG